MTEGHPLGEAIMTDHTTEGASVSLQDGVGGTTIPLPGGVGIGMMVEIGMITMAIVMEMTGGSMINMMTIAGGDMGVVILQEEGGDLTTETEGGIGVVVTTVTYHQEIEKAREICQKVNCVSLMLYCGMYAHTFT